MNSVRRRAIVALVGALLPLLTVESPVAHAAGGRTYTVVLESDLGDGDLSDGVCSTVPASPPDPATCTLRAAIQNANRDAAKATIAFALGPPGVISLSQYLPNLRRPVDLDGWTQPGSRSTGTPIPRPGVRIDG